MKKLDFTTTILRAIASKNMKKTDIAVIYIILLTRQTRAAIPTINEAIIERWSSSGLQDVKRLAWREIEKRNIGDPRDSLI